MPYASWRGYGDRDENTTSQAKADLTEIIQKIESKIIQEFPWTLRVIIGAINVQNEQDGCSFVPDS